MVPDRRNWREIAEIDDSELRFFFMTVEHEGLLEGLARGFPELFLHEPKEFVVPLTLVKQAVVEEHRRDWPHDSEASHAEMAERCWMEGCVKLSVPIVALRVGLELERQLQHYGAWTKAVGTIVTVLGDRLLVIDVAEEEHLIWVVRPDHIDLSS